MEICLVGDYSGNIDEGLKKVAFHLANELSLRHKVVKLMPRSILTINSLRSVRKFNPRVIHYIPGLSFASFMLVKTLALYCPNAKVIMSALQPLFPHLLKMFIPLFRINLILTQSCETEEMLSKLKCNTAFLPNGVDVKKFVPIGKEAKDELRNRYGLSKEKFIVLHVGHVKKGRNLDNLNRVQNDENQVIIVGSTSTRIEPELCRELEGKGCLIWKNYLSRIQEVYALSDCYIFPTINKPEGIELPLSVLEAMACNLPVISTRFGALPRLFDEGDGLVFVDEGDEFRDKIQAIKQRNVDIQTREKVLPYSWQEVTGRLEEIYNEVISH